ncbi:PREDICTED: uncharacterized protein LOC105948616 [Erythranthe guttata]|uniref:uncharacterized protein LOC105948616 n=1 Tax=Erythranthe guttata TaxID=4155 RepID=UPI00064E0DA4|nr:PREDICTED: uncharacterized protein LOC105948616 [Erythranthe guttata]|eukprot:XP_012827288.1 PREDICTED: uncharacterized protein LOC105948616 [Erythranthe guttata]
MRGLRQRDPYHHTCYLSQLLHVRPMEQEINYHPMCHLHKITHMIFADDLMVLSRRDVESVRILTKMVYEFGQVLGIKATHIKSNIFLAGVKPGDRLNTENEFHFATGVFPYRYLGIPLVVSKLRVLNYQPLLDKIEQAIGAWTCQTLSYPSRLEILKTVVQGTCCY